MEKPTLVQLLKMNAGLNDNEALIYKHILVVGSLTIGEIIEYTGFVHEEASRALDRLVEKKLIRRLAYVVDRYVAVAPYRAFAELLVEFQRAMRELEENSVKSIHQTLMEISRINAEWKANAIQVRDEQISQAKQDVRKLLEEASNARNSLVEELRSETEDKKSLLTTVLKKQVGEYAARVSEIKKEITLKIDNSVAKVLETTARLKEQVAQNARSYLSKFDEKLRSFLGMIRDNLVAFQSNFFSSVDGIQVQYSTFIEDSNSEVRRLTESVRNKTDELMHRYEGSFSQLSTEILKTVSSDVDSTMESLTATDKDLELNVTNTVRTQGEKLNEMMKGFQEKATETLDRWKSVAKEKTQDSANTFVATIGENLEALNQKMDSAKTQMSEILRSHLASAETASSDFASNIGTITQSLRADLTTKTASPTKELQELCNTAAKECGSLVAALETLSKKNVPLASKAIEDFTSDVNSKLTKMTTSYVTNARSFAAEVKEKVLEALTSILATQQLKGSPAEASKKGDEALLKGSAFKKDLSKRIDGIVGTYIDDLKSGINALDKYAAERMSATSGFEKELEERWGAITGTLQKVTGMANEIKLFPQRVGEIVNELVDKYGKRAEGIVNTATRLLTIHSTTLRDTISSTERKWSAAVDETKKEVAEISAKHRDELGRILSNQIQLAETSTSDGIRALEELLVERSESIRSDSLITQTEISRQVNSAKETSRRFLEDIEATLKNRIQSSQEGLRTTIEDASRDNDRLSSEITRESNTVAARLKEQLTVISNSGKAQVKHICDSANISIGVTISEEGKELHEILSAIVESFNENIDLATGGYKSEGESIKELIAAILSQHLTNYNESVSRVMDETNTTLTKHFEDCNRLTENFGMKLDELAKIHQDKYEKASIKLVDGLTNCLDLDETAIKKTSEKMLKEFTDNTARSAKEAGSVETLMRETWSEITDTQQINADKTWHCVTKQAILINIKDMAKRTKSTVTIVVPSIEEAPIKEIKEISKAIRINIIAGIDESSHNKLLRDLLAQGNVRIWNLTEKNYISCTRDAEEVLIAPIAARDIDCVALVSTEEGFIKLIMKIVGPMWLAASKMVSSASLKP